MPSAIDQKGSTVTFSERPPSTCSSIPFAQKPTPRPGSDTGSRMGSARTAMPVSIMRPPDGASAANTMMSPLPPQAMVPDSARSGVTPSSSRLGSSRGVPLGAAPYAQASAAPEMVATVNLQQLVPTDQHQGMISSARSAGSGSAAGPHAMSGAPVALPPTSAEDAPPDSVRSSQAGGPMPGPGAELQGGAPLQQPPTELEQGGELQQQPQPQFLHEEPPPVYHEGRYNAYKAKVKNMAGCHLRAPFASDFDDMNAQDLPPAWAIQYPNAQPLPPLGGPGERPLPTAAEAYTKREAFMENRHIADHCKMRDRYGSRIFG
ncbi:unnamed protein product [Amoebophrya sp. A25]|nr:unnamed protein product [Amoebophrya sp. A25]|eukprot:GSA25T00010114001.1